VRLKAIQEILDRGGMQVVQRVETKNLSMNVSTDRASTMRSKRCCRTADRERRPVRQTSSRWTPWSSRWFDGPR